MSDRVQANRVRFIRLGESSSWAKECLRSDTLRIGFWTQELFDLCTNSKWQELARAFEKRGKSKATITNFVAQVRAVFEDDGTTLWATFHAGRMYWTFIDARLMPWPATHGEEGCYRQTRPWRSETINGVPLWMTALPGWLTKTAGFPGTSCDMERPEDVIRRVNGDVIPEIATADRLLLELQASVVPLLHLMDWRDFELLVGLIFSTSGWRRQGRVGEEQETSDIEIELPSTGERAFVQIKSAANQTEFDEYRSKFGGSAYDRMFYAYHQGQIQTTDSRITLLGPERLARMVVEAGLVSWVLDKVR
jgi:hypothetical protein